jgi:hypothetical protein
VNKNNGKSHSNGKNGKKPPPRRAPDRSPCEQYSPEVKEQCIRMMVEGCYSRQVAMKTGIPSRLIRSWAAQAGVKFAELYQDVLTDIAEDTFRLLNNNLETLNYHAELLRSPEFIKDAEPFRIDAIVNAMGTMAKNTYQLLGFVQRGSERLATGSAGELGPGAPPEVV